MIKPFLILIALLFSISVQGQDIYSQKLLLMGSRFDISIVANNSTEANTYIDLAVTEITRIEKLISSWDKNSQTSEIIRNAGIKAVKVDKELFDLIERSLIISKLTDGAFDISYASMDKIWRFDGTMTIFPSKEEVKKSVSKVGYKNVVLNNFETFINLLF